MKLVAIFIALAVAVSTMVIACHCCPLQTHDSGLGIAKTPCHSCCPGSSEMARDCGTVYEKQTLNVPHESVVALSAIQIKTAYSVRQEKTLHVLETSPLSSPPSLSLVLRI